MSVKFEKDTVKTTVGSAANQVATAASGSKVANGYLAVRLPNIELRIQLTDMATRHTSRSSRRTLSEPRC
jgi:hypothetical protein